MTLVYLGLGGNVGDVALTLKKALEALAAHPAIHSFRVARFYRTEPVNIADGGGWFVNTACCFETSLSPLELMAVTEEIERSLGKKKKPKDASRPIDIDILFYGDLVLSLPNLEIPHPRWRERNFVLAPLADLVEEIQGVNLKTLETGKGVMLI